MEKLRFRDSGVYELKRCEREIASKSNSLQVKVILIGRQLSEARDNSSNYRGLHHELVAHYLGSKLKPRSLYLCMEKMLLRQALMP